MVAGLTPASYPLHERRAARSTPRAAAPGEFPVDGEHVVAEAVRGRCERRWIGPRRAVCPTVAL